ncbi:hypothetical protein VHEMI09702 [[Torrubiella] hemipterigena]|uniref:Uncharacterized protein n=1 Tax=[Torrubiella] hemipterigena TaxID=1531966 RepID=A0A0A1TAP3_9HYPO|nr:hypothetical protein VHEMI09702 [[Torrubiella] hemipterigena]
MSHDDGDVVPEADQLCLDILAGTAVPTASQCTKTKGYNELNPTHLCFISSVRRRLEYGPRPDVVLLCTSPGTDPALARAYYARLIMSNTVPDIPEASFPSAPPYSICYPDIASEDTYRAVAKRYPGLRYQVGRACAVAGYATLYEELDLLPDV